MRDTKAVVYIVEDDVSFRKSMERLIRGLGCDAVVFESANSFLAQDSIRHPGCLLLDVRLPDIDGLQLQQKIRECGVNLPIIFMTGHGNIPMSVEAMKKGAVDFLPKPFGKQELFSAIEEAIERDILNLIEESQKSKVSALTDTLTPRELEIMRWVITGMLNKQIAYELNISEKTVKVHRGRVMQKTNVTSVAELVRLAELAGISPAK